MNLFQLFSKHAPNRVFIGVILGALSGIAYSIMIPVLMLSLSPTVGHAPENNHPIQFYGVDILHYKVAVFFLGLCLFILIARTSSQIVLARVGMEVTGKLRQDLYKRISKTSIASLEQTSNGRLIQAMSTDVQNIVQGAGTLPDLFIQLCTLLGLLGILCYLNLDLFILILIVITFGVITFQLPMMVGIRYFTRARDHMDLLQEGFSGLVDGAKELKLNYKKQKNFMDNDLVLQEKMILRLENIGLTIVNLSKNYGDLITFFTIGCVSFVFVNYYAVSVIELTGIVMVLLYITGPVGYILNVIPDLTKARVSLRKIQNLYAQIPSENASEKIYCVPNWKAIHLKSVTYVHTNGKNNEQRFTVGPIDAEIRRGEITFVVGGNGSGKSTISKVISLHYLVSGGQIAFDDELITPKNICSYRQEISCIYSDYYLFKRLYNDFCMRSNVADEINYYLDRFELKENVKFQDGHFSTLKLSDGQRRRLALLVAFLDDKALYLFDEWAADQDPNFKKVFYYEILPYLRSKGKAIVVISHDDRYFDVADKILAMEEGVLR
jgi:putative ATP-binding cassette transporter